MYAVETLRTDDQESRERGDWWREKISTIHCPMAFAIPQDYRGEVAVQSSEAYQLVQWWGDAELISRRPVDIDRHPHEAYELLLPVRGVLTVRHGTGERRITPADMIVTSLDTAVDLQHGDDFSSVAFVIPREKLDARIPSLPHSGRVLNSESGLGRILVDILTSLRSQRDAITSGQFDAIADRAVDLLALAYHADNAAPSADVQNGIVTAIRRFVRENAHDPALSGGVVAARLGWSLRHVQVHLQRIGTTPSELIRHERLTLARCRLQDPGWAQRSITEIAYTSGFGDLSTFSNAYRRMFGERPSDTRSAAHVAG